MLLMYNVLVHIRLYHLYPIVLILFCYHNIHGYHLVHIHVNLHPDLHPMIILSILHLYLWLYNILLFHRLLYIHFLLLLPLLYFLHFLILMSMRMYHLHLLVCFLQYRLNVALSHFRNNSLHNQ